MNPLKLHLVKLPQDIVDFLLGEFQKIHSEYFLGHWQPSQLDGGRFAEAVLRILEYKDKGSFTPIGKQLNRQVIANSVRNNTSLTESLRFQILGLAELILDFRNKRNVGHLGLIDVNEMDSNFVMQSSNWIVAELIRLETSMSPSEAQNEIKNIIERKIPVIEEIDKDRFKILNPSLDIKEKILLMLYQSYPKKISVIQLIDWTGYDKKKSTRFKSYLKQLDKESLIDFREDNSMLTKRGVVFVEKNIRFEIDS
jgi:hypothetical protein